MTKLSIRSSLRTGWAAWSDTCRQLLSIILLLAFAVPGFAADIPRRPLSAKGAEAKTLLIYADQRMAYSLNDSLELLKLQLLRVATRLEGIPIAQATPEKMAGAEYLVVFCPQSAPALTTNFLHAIAQSKQPVLWVGYGADKMEEQAPFTNSFRVSTFSAANVETNVNYRGRDWNAPVAPWIPATLKSNSQAKVVMAVGRRNGPFPPPYSLCWTVSNITFFAGIPNGDRIGFLFEDMLLGFYGAQNVSAPRLLLRIEDYNPGSDHREFHRLADYLHSRQIPFVIAVVPASRDPETSKIEDMASEPQFVNSLRYAQQRGGRLIVKGFTHDPAKGEFWNTEQDRPLADDRPEKIRERLQAVVRQMLQHGLFPLGWETPAYAASRKDYAEIAQTFSTAVERVQLSDSTHLDSGVTAGLTVDRYDRLIVPENMSFVLDADGNSFDAIRATGEIVTRLRGSIGGCYFFAYQPLEKLTGLVDTLENFRTPYLDLADLDNVVQLPETVLLGGHAQRTVTLRNATVQWKAFNRAGKLLAEEKEAAKTSGSRLLKRRGVGDYEVFDFSEGK